MTEPMSPMPHSTVSSVPRVTSLAVTSKAGAVKGAQAHICSPPYHRTLSPNEACTEDLTVASPPRLQPCPISP